MNDFNILFSNPLSALLIIITICLLEVILSIDNAALLALMVKDLPKDQQNKALRYGIFGAYIFRGLSLLFVSVLIHYWWIKPIGGLYLIWMSYSYFKGLNTESADDDSVDKNSSWLYKYTVGYLGILWSTIIMVEFLDMTMSIDNIFAVTAFSSNIVLIIFGVFIGILAMRFVAQAFVKLMEKYKFLETCAFVVIGILGIKLFASIFVHFDDNLKWIDSEAFDWSMSVLTILIFVVPVIIHNLFKRAASKIVNHDNIQ